MAPVFSGQPVFHSAASFSLGKGVFSRPLGFLSAARFSLGVAVLARRCCFLLGLGFLLTSDFGSWLLPVAARSGLCSLSFLFFSPLSFSELKILLTTGLGYCLPYIIPSKIFSRRHGFLSAPVCSWQHGFRLAVWPWLGGGVVFFRYHCFQLAAQYAQQCSFPLEPSFLSFSSK